ncbi:MAG: NPCBM/NEW2 domain-containing protein [Phycisphaerae bacterium]|nr:NPCBM/NEW2 domain-containing protein [Phycisphaerae bacterium]
MPYLKDTLIRYGLLVLLISEAVCFSQVPGSSGNQAMFRFRVEPDAAAYRIPDQFLSDTAILPKPSSRDHRGFSKRREAGLWLNSRIHHQGLGCSVPSRVVYDLSKTAEIDRFVALIGPDSRFQGRFNITFEVHADDQLLYQSRPLKNAKASDFISVKIPPDSLRLRPSAAWESSRKPGPPIEPLTRITPTAPPCPKPVRRS